MKKIVSVVLSLCLILGTVTAFGAVSYDAGKSSFLFNFEDGNLFFTSTATENYSIISDPTGNTGNNVLKVYNPPKKDMNAYINGNFPIDGLSAISYDIYVDEFDFSAYPDYNDVFGLTYYYKSDESASEDFIGYRRMGRVAVNADRNAFVFHSEGGVENLTSYKADMAQDTWYRVIAMFNPADSTIKGYSINLSTGEKNLIYVWQNKPVYSITRLQYPGGVNQTTYIDNVRFYKAVGENSLSVNGADVSVSLTNDVQSAKLYIDGNFVSDIDNKSCDAYYTVSDLEFAAIRTHEARLVCYDENDNIIDEVNTEFSFDEILWNQLATKNTDMTVAAGIPTKTSGDCYLKNYVIGHNYSVLEFDFSFKTLPTTGDVQVEARVSKAASDNTYGAYKIITNGGNLITGVPMSADTTYRFKYIHDSINGVYKMEIDGNNILTAASSDYINFNGVKFENSSDADITVTNIAAYQRITIPVLNASAYKNYADAEVTIDSAIPSSAKAVVIDVSDKYAFDTNNVKLYKDGIEVGCTASLDGEKLYVSADKFECGEYKVEISGVAYDGTAIDKNFEVYIAVDTGLAINPVSITTEGSVASALVTYKNVSGTDVTAKLIVASYVGNKLSAVNIAPVNFASGDSLSAAPVLTLNLNSGDDSIKAMIVDNYSSLMPMIGASKIAIQN